jgi:hypothetical protein
MSTWFLRIMTRYAPPVARVPRAPRGAMSRC